MIELNPTELVIFGVLCLVVGNIIIFAIVWTWNRIIDWCDGTIRKKPGTQTLRGLFKGDYRA